MRVLSARIQRARRDRTSDTVAAIVALAVDRGDTVVRTFVSVTAPGRAPGAAPLRDRLLGAAKLSFMLSAPRSQSRRAA